MNKPIFFFIVLVFVGCNNPSKNNTSNNLETQANSFPDSLPLQYAYINQLDSSNNTNKAIEQINKLLVKDNGNADLWFKKAQLHEKTTDTVLAIEAYSKAATIYPAPQILLALANLYAETKNPLVTNICNQINSLQLGREYDGYTNFFKGVYAARTGNFSTAINLFNQSIALNYTLMDAYMEKGYLLYDLKKYAEAIETFSLATTVNNTYADGFYWQAKCYEMLGKKQAAINNYQAAYQLNNSIVEAQQALQRLQ
jgi:tetratricopeptide (TPR) repeat protein